MDASMISRAALGKVAYLGELYDARIDDFCAISAFKTDIPEAAVTVKDSHHADVEFVLSDDFSEKSSKLDVNAELQVSVLSGMLKLGGSGKYLTDQKRSARSVKTSLVYNVKTKNETLNIYHENLKDKFSADAIENSGATHLVVGISWGGNCILSCLYENRENKDIKQIEGNLSAGMEKAILSIHGSGDTEYNESENFGGIKVEISLVGDVLPPEDELPTTLQPALQMMKQVPKLVANSNNGKGKPLQYQMIPVALIQTLLNFSLKADQVLKDLEKSTLDRVILHCKEISKSRQEVHDVYQDALDYQFCVPESTLQQIVDLENSTSIHESSFQSDLANLLTEVRSGRSNSSELEMLMKNYQSKEDAPASVKGKLALLNSTAEKISFARVLIEKGCKYIGRGSDFENEKYKDMNAKLYVLHFSEISKSANPIAWNKNKYLFFQELQKKTENCKYFALDYDVSSSSEIPFPSGCVQVIQGGRVLVNDLVADREKLGNTPLISFTVKANTLLDGRDSWPKSSVPFSCVCSGGPCNKQKIYEWVCNICAERCYYGHNQHFYCGCGEYPIKGAEFKCTDMNHGLSFTEHQEEFMMQILASHPAPFNKIIEEFDVKLGSLRTIENNILVFSQSETTSAAWMNAFVNLFAYDTLKDAQLGNLFTVNPSTFTHSFHSGLVGYVVGLGNITMRFIPMILDPSNNYIELLNSVIPFSAIVILLPAQTTGLESELSDTLANVLKIFGHLTEKNLVFSFTSTLGSFPEIGNVVGKIKNLLSSINLGVAVSGKSIYRIDEQVYHILAGMRFDTPVDISRPQMDLLSLHWKIYHQETHRFFSYLSTVNTFRFLETNFEEIRHHPEIMRQCATSLQMIYIYCNSKNYYNDKPTGEQVANNKLKLLPMLSKLERAAAFVYVVLSAKQQYEDVVENHLKVQLLGRLELVSYLSQRDQLLHEYKTGQMPKDVPFTFKEFKELLEKAKEDTEKLPGCCIL